MRQSSDYSRYFYLIHISESEYNRVMLGLQPEIEIIRPVVAAI